MSGLFEELMASTTRKDPFQSGRQAFLRGEGAERCPRYPSAYDREKWHKGFDLEMRKAIKAFQERKERERRGLLPRIINTLR